MRKKIVRKAAAFFLIGCFLFTFLNTLLVEKASYAKYRGWKAVENVDILILGNSHADGGFRAADISSELCAGGDASVFNYALMGMRMEQMYFFVKEILKTHVPDLIVLETYAFCPLADEHREILARRAFDVFPLSLNKIEAIRYCVIEDRASFLFPIMKYHTRWKEISPGDFRLLYDRETWKLTGGNGNSDDGSLCPDPGDDWFQQTPPEDIREITPTEKECLEKLLALLEERNIPLLFVSVPFKVQMDLNSMEQVKINNYLRENYVNGDTVRLLDMNRMWRELDFGYDDLGNEGHVNASGADKVSDCLVEYLKENYDLAALTAQQRRK